MNDVELDERFQQHQILRRQLPNSWNAFFARFGSLRPVQLEAIPPILAGENVLITAPTAGGKTEAVVAPICERMTRDRWAGLSVLLVTPTRSLVNDLYARLEIPCGEMGVRLGRKTADHAVSSDFHEQLLITTPESLESLLTFNRQSLVHLRAIIVDEIHLLDGSPRGDQLRLLLQRVRRFLDYVHRDAPRCLQTIAVSATVPQPEKTATAYLGLHARIVKISGQRDVEARIILADGDDRQRAIAAIDAAEEFADARKILVFANSRKQVDRDASYFQHGRFAAKPVYCHHGNLSKSQRETTESRFKADSMALCLATTTLEIGIDIGDVDLVICMNPPWSVASFLQRIGRGCRRLQGKTRVLCVAKNRVDEILFDGLIRQARIGLRAGPAIPLRRSVLVQQVMAYLNQVDRHARTADQFHKVLCTDAPPTVSPLIIDEVLRDLVQSDFLVEQNGVFMPASRGWSFIQSSKIYCNIEPPPTEIQVVDVETGKAIATVAGFEDGAEGVRIAGQPYKFLPGVGAIRKVRSEGEHPFAPKYHVKNLPRSYDLVMAAARSLNLPEDRLAILQIDGHVVVMTWLGSLMNHCLSAMMKRERIEAFPTAFAIRCSHVDPNDVLPLLHRLVTQLKTTNPLGNLSIERLEDLGPYFRELSDELKNTAREDWLDSEFFCNWINRITTIDIYTLESPVADDLIAMASD